GEGGDREVAGDFARAAAGGDVGDGAVLADRDVGRFGRQLDVAVGGAGAGRFAAQHVEAVLGDQVALGVEGAVAGPGVEVVGGQGRRVAAGDDEHALALDRDVGGVAGRLQGAAAHHVVDRAELDPEPDLGRVAAALAGARRGGADLQLVERVLE